MPQAFKDLPPEVQELTRRKQMEAKEKKRRAKGRQKSYGVFPRSSFPANIESIDLILRLMREKSVVARNPHSGAAVTMDQFNYFLFTGGHDAVWSAEFYARQAWEGFFTITTSRRRSRNASKEELDHEPLPELQPFYSVVDWPFFHSSKHVRKAFARLRKSNRRFRFRNHRDGLVLREKMDAFHTATHGSSWLTAPYLDLMRRANDDPRLNFQLNVIEMYEVLEEDMEGAGEGGSSVRKERLIAGEIGYTVGRIYSSLSGYHDPRGEGGAESGPGVGRTQLVLLGAWLQQRGYAFWSLGHCYSPEMDYKRQLGHRVLPRSAFLDRMHKDRGEFYLNSNGGKDPGGPETVLLKDGDSCDSSELLNWICATVATK